MRKLGRIAALVLAFTLFLPLFFAAPAGAASVQRGLSAGIYHTLELAADGTLRSWGYNRYGQLGDGGDAPRATPYEVMGDVRQAVAGRWCSYALKTDGTLYAWGNNEQGQLGLGDTKNRSTPTRVMGGVRRIAATLNRAYALDDSGKLYAWGNASFDYPDGERLKKTPRVVADAVDDVFCGGSATLILRGGVLYALGGAVTGSSGEVRIASNVLTAAATSDEILFIDSVGRLCRFAGGSTRVLLNEMASVEANGGRYAAISRTGALYTWGVNSSGELGLGHYAKVNSPTLALHDVADVAIGGSSIAVLKKNGELWVSGSNGNYQLGSGEDRLSYNSFHRVREGGLPARELASGEYKVVLDGERMSFDVPPHERSGRLLVPMRAIFEALGAAVDWQDETNTATATLGERTVEVTIGSETARVNGDAVKLDVPAVEMNWRTLVPLRFIATALGARVDYFGGERLVEIRSPNAGSELNADVLAAQSVAIAVELNDGARGTASGVVVHGGGLVLTNRHVVENARQIVVSVGGRSHTAEVVCMSENVDAAIVRVRTSGLCSARTAYKPPTDGDKLTIYDGSTAKMVATRVTLEDYGGGSVLVNARLLQGASGSGVYDVHGRLVGLVWAAASGQRAAVLPYTEFEELIDRAVAECGSG